MQRKLASIQKIIELQPIPKADKIEVATILGWKAVVQKGMFKVGELVTYLEVDSWLPEKPEYEFLRKSCWKENENGKGFRIKTIRLKGQISQGLVLSASILGNVPIEEGLDVTEKLGVKLYNPPIPADLKGQIKGNLPWFCPKTDETRVQLLQDILVRLKGLKCYVTEKIDGSSATFYWYKDQFGVCSRNLELIETPGNAFWKIARELNIEEKLKKTGKNITLQGELCGVGIQGNPLQMEKRYVLFFNVFDIDAFKYYDFEEARKFLIDLDLPMVPLVTTDYELVDNIPDLVSFATSRSKLNTKKWREGIVIRPMKEMVDLRMSNEFNSGRVSFKVINPEYLLEADQ